MSVVARTGLLSLLAVLALAALFLNFDSAQAELVRLSNEEEKCADNKDVNCVSISHVEWQHEIPHKDDKDEDSTGDWQWDITETARIENKGQPNEENWSEFQITGYHKKGPHTGEKLGDTIIVDFSYITLLIPREPLTKTKSAPHNDHFDVLTVTVGERGVSSNRDVKIHFEHQTEDYSVGGVMELLRDGSDAPASAAQGSGSSAPPYAVIAGAAGAAAALAVTAGGWYARRRWLG